MKCWSIQLAGMEKLKKKKNTILFTKYSSLGCIYCSPTQSGANLQIALVRGCVHTYVRPSQFISGTAEHIFLKFCTELEEKKRRKLCTGPDFWKKWLKITILISASRRTSNTAACYYYNDFLLITNLDFSIQKNHVKA
jgi:hypothetical protein